MKLESSVIPQANELTRVLKIPILITDGCVTASQIAPQLGFSVRQASYYIAASTLLGLIQKKAGDSCYELSVLGKDFISRGTTQKKDLALAAIEHLEIFKEIFEINKKKFSKKEIASIIREKSGLSVATAERRADTIISWVFWLAHHFPHLYEIEDGLVSHK